MLMLTHACNLNCVYCYEKHKSSREMSFDTARKCLESEIEFVAKSKKKFDSLSVEFMGGEPFLRFDLIRQIVEWLASQDVPFQWLASSSTNGTLFTPEIMAWMVANKERFIPCLSFDGTPDMQGNNRTNQDFTSILPFLIEHWPHQEIHMTVSHQTLSNLADGIFWLQDKGAKVSVALAQGEAWEEPDSMILSQQIRKLGRHYLTHDDQRPVSFICRPLFEISGKTTRQHKFCGAGTHMVAYDVDGRKYPCHMFTPLVRGCDDWADKPLVRGNGWRFSDRKCDDCILKNWCSTCCGFNLLKRDGLNMRDHGACEMVFAEAREFCDFQLSYYDKHRTRITSADADQLAAALAAHEVLFNAEAPVNDVYGEPITPEAEDWRSLC